MSLYSKVFLTYTVLLAGVIAFIHLRYDPEIVECGTAVMQYDEEKGVYFYETPTFRKELVYSENTSRSPQNTLQWKDAAIYAGMPVSYVIYGGDDRLLEDKLKVLSREQWEAQLTKSHWGGCLFGFACFWILGAGIWWSHWSEDAKTITVPVVGDR